MTEYGIHILGILSVLKMKYAHIQDLVARECITFVCKW